MVMQNELFISTNKPVASILHANKYLVTVMVFY